MGSGSVGCSVTVSPQFPRSDRPRSSSLHYCVWRNVTVDARPVSYTRPLAYGHVPVCRYSHSNQRPCTNLHVTGQECPRSQVHVFADHTAILEVEKLAAADAAAHARPDR